MELNIKNFARIKEASIKLEGITVIAGENNTGKTTIGKIIFASFNSINSIDTKVEKEINLSVRNLIISFLELILPYRRKNGIININRIHYNNILNDILNDISNEKESEYIEKIITDNIKKFTISIDKPILENIKFVASKIEEYKNISYKKLACNIISDYYNKIFYNQINSRIDKNMKSEIEIKNIGIFFEFQNDRCSNFKKNIHNNNVFFIYDPFILDRIHFILNSINTNKENSSNLKKYFPEIESHLLYKIFNAYNENYILDETLAEEKLENIYNKLSLAVNGKIIVKEGDFYLEFNNFIEPISIHNLSAGLKSFTIIKMLLEKNVLKENDILVLDEPEIHLHPKWQLLYAEIIVLIQKAFNLYIVITTHSPFFLEAIELYTKKYKVDDKTNYYLSNIKDNHSEMKLVNDRIYDIYNEMAAPIEDLEELADELGGDE